MKLEILVNLENAAFLDDDETINPAAVVAAIEAIAHETGKSLSFWKTAGAFPGVVLSAGPWRFFVHDINGNRCGVVRCAPDETIDAWPK